MSALVILLAMWPLGYYIEGKTAEIAEWLMPYEAPPESQIQAELQALNAKEYEEFQQARERSIAAGIVYFDEWPNAVDKKTTIDDVLDKHRDAYRWEEQRKKERKVRDALAWSLVVPFLIGLFLLRTFFRWASVYWHSAARRHLQRALSIKPTWFWSTRKARMLDSLNAEFARAEALYARRLISEQDLEAQRTRIQHAIAEKGLLDP